MPPLRSEWATGFLDQSRSDWAVFRKLYQDEDVPLCHPLHYLQMACEKLAKAHRLQSTAADVAGLLERHVGFVRFVRSYLRSNEMKGRYQGRHSQLQELARLCAQIAARSRSWLRRWTGPPDRRTRNTPGPMAIGLSSLPGTPTRTSRSSRPPAAAPSSG